MSSAVFDSSSTFWPVNQPKALLLLYYVLLAPVIGYTTEAEYRSVKVCSRSLRYCVPQVTEIIRSYELNSNPVRHDVTFRFPVCYGSPSDVFAANSSLVRVVRIQNDLKGKRNQRWWWQTQMYASREVDSGSSLLADLNLRRSEGYIKISPVFIAVNLNFYFI